MVSIMVNNLKLIRDLYGATQEQVATAVNVNRVTVANWESGNSVASSSNQEKLSLYYGIGPEYFYDKDLDETARQIVVQSGITAREVLEKTAGKRVKEDDFHRAFESIDFKEALDRYMFSMKLLLATADNGKLDKLETALLINRKMGARLEAIVELRKQEERKGEPTLLDLLEQIEEGV
ncbi:MAG: helix-turn-helix transcriptional regulator [Oscillospiraceae bacterium]|nr:helix-turn-helix transcriptional regulator [Oscillospiraceae bacterium]